MIMSLQEFVGQFVIGDEPEAHQQAMQEVLTQMKEGGYYFDGIATGGRREVVLYGKDINDVDPGYWLDEYDELEISIKVA